MIKKGNLQNMTCFRKMVGYQRWTRIRSLATFFGFEFWEKTGFGFMVWCI